MNELIFVFVAPPAIDTWKEMYSTYPDLTYRKIRDLKSDTIYMITIWAETNAGRGQEMTIEETTVSEDGKITYLPPSGFNSTEVKV